MASGTSASTFPRWSAFFHRHPVLLLLCLTPGIPEYLSGSTKTEFLVLSPGVFLLFLVLNLGLYGPGVLIVREAFVRWRTGWAGVLLLGAAYGLLEEGTALSTLFNPKASVVGSQGYYGHYLGVNWVWTVGVLGVHIVLSVGVPILLLGLALPETRGKSLLTNRQVAIAALLYALDIAALAFAVGYYRTAPMLLVLAVVVALLLYALARQLPKGSLDPTGDLPRHRPWVFLVLGIAFYPLVLLLFPGFGMAANLWPPVVMAVEVALGALLFLYVRRTIGRRNNEAALTMLALGTLIPIAAIGLVVQLLVPVELVVDVLFVLFFYALWKRYRPIPTATLPSGVSG